MRRKDREITDLEEIMNIIRACRVCRLGMADGDRPYVVPLNFGVQMENGAVTLYFHGAKEGRKLDILRKNPAVCVEFDLGHQLLEGDVPCACSFAYESVIGFGRGEILERHEDKARGLAAIHRQMSGKEYEFTPEQTGIVAVLRVELQEVAGKRRAAV